MSAPPRPGGSRPTSPAPPPREDSKYDYYAAYDSPFECYPLLRLRARHMFSGDSTSAAQKITTLASHSPTTICSPQSSLSSFPSSSSILSASSSITSLPSSSSSSTYNSVFPLPNLKPLKLATCSALDPAKRICQYEVPGGGVCRDAGCEDLHLSRLGREGGVGVVEPSGTSLWVMLSSMGSASLFLSFLSLSCALSPLFHRFRHCGVPLRPTALGLANETRCQHPRDRRRAAGSAGQEPSARV